MTKTPEELTADWKEGKLKAGSYYVQYADGEIEIERASEWFKSGDISCGINFDDPVYVYKVLAPVPTYNEYKAMQDHILYLEKCISIYEQKEKQHTNDSIEYNKLEKENNNLRALLRECYKKADEALQEIQKDCEADEWTIYHYKNVQEFYNLLTRINSALGESEA